MNEWMKKEWMLKEFERIWPAGKGTTLYKLIERKDEFKKDDCKFELLFKQSVLKYDYDTETYGLWGGEPNLHEILLDFLINVAKAIGQCFIGEREKLYKSIYSDLYTLDLLYKPILQIETLVELGDKITETNAEAYLEAKEFKF
ncbi:MAG: hypothetical protein V3G53_02490 [Candidatus Enteromonas sp.]